MCTQCWKSNCRVYSKTEVYEVKATQTCPPEEEASDKPCLLSPDGDPWSPNMQDRSPFGDRGIIQSRRNRKIVAPCRVHANTKGLRGGGVARSP